MIDIEVIGVEEVVDKLHSMDERMENPSDVLEDIAGTMILPEVKTASMTVWGVRTGHYSNSWYAEMHGEKEMEIGNTALYSAPLETGWTSRGGKFISSPGVLLPVILELWPAITERWDAWAREITSR